MMPAKYSTDDVPKFIVHVHPLDGAGRWGPMISRLAVPPDAVRTPSSLMRAHDHATSPARVGMGDAQLRGFTGREGHWV